MKKKLITIINIEDKIIQISCYIKNEKPLLIYNENYSIKENSPDCISSSFKIIFKRIYENFKIKISDYYAVIQYNDVQILTEFKEKRFESKTIPPKDWYPKLSSQITKENSDDENICINVVPTDIIINEKRYKGIPHDIKIRSYKLEFKVFKIPKKIYLKFMYKYKCKIAKLKSLILTNVALQMYIKTINLKKRFPKTYDKNIILINFQDRQTTVYKYSNHQIKIHSAENGFGIYWIFYLNQKIFNYDYNQYTLFFFSSRSTSKIFEKYNFKKFNYSNSDEQAISFTEAINSIQQNIDNYIKKHIYEGEKNYIILGRIVKYAYLQDILDNYKSITWYCEKRKNLRMELSVFVKIYGAMMYIFI